MRRYDIINMYGDVYIWTLVLGYPPKIGKCKSPFRTDKTASCGFYVTQKGYIRFKDFATGENLDCLDAYEKVYGDNNVPAPSLYVSSIPQPVIKKTSKTNIEIQRGNWTTERMDYWKNYQIDIDLVKQEVIVCKFITITKDHDEYTLIPEYHSYAYVFPSGRFKIYQPFSTTKKWLGNSTSSDIYGYDSVEGYDTIIVTKSGKDYLLLRTIKEKYNLEIDIIAPNGEGYVIPKDKRKILDGKKVIIYYDNDEPGILNANKHKDIYNAELLFNPQYKDASDWSFENPQEFEEWFLEKL